MKLYVYEHCPYCIITRMAFAVKKIPYTMEYLYYDDVKAHVDKIGVKQVPILQKDDGSHMGESIDIVKYLDSLAKPTIFHTYTRREDIAQLFSDQNLLPIRSLSFLAAIDRNFPEISTPSSKQYYIDKHMSRLPYNTIEDMKIQVASFKKAVTQFMQKLVPLLYTEHHMSKQGFGIDDLLCFSRLYALVNIGDVQIPAKLERYMDNMFSLTNMEKPDQW